MDRHHRDEIYKDAKSAKRFNHDTFHGFDFDSTMLRVGSMNMLLHGVENPAIENRDSLSEGHASVEGQFSLILANPPFAGSLLFTKTNSAGTDHVWFYDMQADGYSLDDKRNPLDASKHECNNLPDILTRWQSLTSPLPPGEGPGVRATNDETSRARTDQSFLVPKTEIAGNDYDLSINRYKQVVYEQVEHEPPQKILAELKKLEAA